MFVDVTDTKPNSWVWAVVEPMKELGLLASNERFNPEQDITKAEGIGMMIKAIYGSEYSYNSNLTTTWQEQVVAFSLSKGITDSFSDYNAKATR
ncbi:MAG: S-layer homology domain-containing protein [Candidatus Peribacteria bacterium]|nr:S-layer homology domain-containing protein [Candidatus Peribacteria bacterium]